VTVVDAGVLVAALTDDGPNGRFAEAALDASELLAPELVLMEATNVLRRLVLSGTLSSDAANLAFEDLSDVPLELIPFYAIKERVWALRMNVTAYNACYVAIAEAVGQPLATLDERLASAPGPTCRFLTPRAPK
jgi:predicted nucleic acid-binding protein